MLYLVKIHGNNFILFVLLMACSYQFLIKRYTISLKIVFNSNQLKRIFCKSSCQYFKILWSISLNVCCLYTCCMRGYQSNPYLFFKLRIQWNIDQQARWLYENTRFSIVMYTFIRLHTYILTHMYTQAHFKTTPLHLMFDAWKMLGL